MRAILTFTVLLVGLITALPERASAEETQYIAVPSIRTDKFSAMGTGYYGGEIDVMTYFNRHGGVNGVKFTFKECETGYDAKKTVECYERLANDGPNGQRTVVFDTLGTPGAYAVINRMAKDHVVLGQYGYGRTDAANGEVWRWVFNAAGQYWSQISATLNFMAQQEGGIEKMKGKKIAHLYIDSAYGKEPIPMMEELAKAWGFELVEIAIPIPSILEQSAQWLQIEQMKPRPDWITFWGAGSGMNSTGMVEAAKINFPRNRMVYVTFGAAEEDMNPAGPAAFGTYAAANARPGLYPFVQKLKDDLYPEHGTKLGNLEKPNRVGSVYYNRGVAAALMWVEAIKNAQKMHNKIGKAVTGDEFRDGYEAIKMPLEHQKEIGIEGMIAPFELSCANHEGAGGKFTIMQWEPTKANKDIGEFVFRTDWIGAHDPSMVRKAVVESSTKFANENHMEIFKCPK